MPAKTNEEIVKFLRARFLSGLVPVRFVAVAMHDDQLIEPCEESTGIGCWTTEMPLTYAMERPDMCPSTISVCGPT
jgi:3-methyladenine DNA glycosylase/8-oxoguanine DNA glycosylase